MAKKPVSVWPLALLLVLPGVGLRGAKAEIPPSSLGYLKSAFADLDALARETKSRGLLPRLADSAQRPSLDHVWDVSAILGVPPYSAHDIPALIEILDKERLVYKSYFLFIPTPQALPDTVSNGLLFQDEIARSTAFLIRTFAAVMPALTDFAAKLAPDQMTEIRRQGLRRMRLGLLEMMSSAVLTIRTPGLKVENQSLVVDALENSGAALVPSLLPEDRDAFIATAKTAIPSLRDADQALLGRFIEVLSTKECVGLCLIR